VVAVVTGGSTGIGLACAEELARAGASLVICARSAVQLEAAAASLAGSRAKVRTVRADVSLADDVAGVFEAADGWGGATALVHAAAVLGPIGAMVGVDSAAWFETIRINLLGTQLVAGEAARRMIAKQRAGAMVLFSGGGGGYAFPNYTAYACSKAAVVRLAETLALELAPHGIRVNSLAPGFVATRMHEATLRAGESSGSEYLERTRMELMRGGTPASVAARATRFLLSPRAAGITGRFVAAPYDGWEHWPEWLDKIAGSDLFTLRRIVPRDRGMDWQ
jgi:NAD(P)-dependent dehydrogenase (short-subunit alcohol dehydrogenase family)